MSIYLAGPYIRCGCDYFEPQGEFTEDGQRLCGCGHLAEQHEDDRDACRMQDGDTWDVEYHPIVQAALDASCICHTGSEPDGSGYREAVRGCPEHHNQDGWDDPPAPPLAPGENPF